jgi:hypothetical protein
MTSKLDREITRKAVRALDDDRPNSVAGDPVKHGRETGPRRVIIGA